MSTENTVGLIVAVYLVACLVLCLMLPERFQ
ncbi:K(+)-transporting ATPase subunit F [Streptomyces sp. NPDC058691]